jgi:DNA-binding CsgD family transcriptional regulator
MAALEAALDAVRQGEPAAVLVGGEAGMGKTRLICEFTAAARDTGVRVLTGACLELGAEGLPYSPFTAMLRDLVREAEPGEIARLLPSGGRAAGELARLLPELAPGRPEAQAGRGDTAPKDAGGWAAEVSAAGSFGGAVTAGEARAHLFEGFLTLLERLAGQRPLVLVIEDAHWADRSSRDLLAFLIGYQRAVRNLLIVVTFRSDELHRTHPLRPLLAELARIDWVDRTELPPLTRGQAEELAAIVRGRPPERSVADAIYERAQGNPLFTEELLVCSDGCDIVPDSLADLLLQAVRRLPEDTQEVLRVASAGSSGVTGDALLAQVTGLDASALAAAIRPAVAANVLVTSGDGYSFRHALIQEAVHADLLPGEHSTVHTRFARAIDADPALVPPGRADIEKAHHWYSAHNTTGALAGSWRASVQASNAVAHAERLMLLDRVLELWDQVPDAAAQIGADHVRVLEEAALAARDAAVAHRGLAFVEAALAELDEADEPVRVALLLRQRFSFQKDLGARYDEADLYRAVALVPEELSRAARTELLLAAAHCGSRIPEAGDWGHDALRLAREIGDRDAEVQALTNLAMIEAGPSQLAASGSEPFRLLEQARQVARQTGAFQPTLKLVILETHLLCGAGDFERAAQAARRGIADTERHGLARTGGAFLSINLAEPLWSLGQWDEATRVAGRALDLAPLPRTRVGLWLVDGAIALARGDLADAARRIGAIRAVLGTGGYDEQHHLPLAVLEIDAALAGEGPAAAVAIAAEMTGKFDVSTASPRYGWPLLVSAVTAACQAPGEEAAALLDRLRTLAEKLDAFGPVQRAWQLMFAAIDPRSPIEPGADAGGGRLAAADAAVAAWEAAGQPYQTAIALVHAARIALAERAGQAAAERLGRAAPIAQRLGAVPLIAQVAELSRRAGGQADAGDPGLTARELEVLRLVAAGHSNREIAAALTISPKTASVHVSNILAKLAAASRTEAAVKAHQLMLLLSPGAASAGDHATLRIQHGPRSRGAASQETRQRPATAAVTALRGHAGVAEPGNSCFEHDHERLLVPLHQQSFVIMGTAVGGVAAARNSRPATLSGPARNRPFAASVRKDGGGARSAAPSVLCCQQKPRQPRFCRGCRVCPVARH